MSKLLEDILAKENLELAYQRVMRNKGTNGGDGMTLEQLKPYLEEHNEEILAKVRQRKYKPKPVRRVEIPKGDGSKRNLGIPTVVDRWLQQAIYQVMSPICEQEFEEMNYGFRPNRSCEMAVIKALEYMNDGYDWIVDIDLTKFFDTVNQDILMILVHNIIRDGDIESLVRKYLQSGVVVDGVFETTPQGTPQGGNLSPLLANIYLNQLDKLLVSRGLRFTRYADDVIIFVKSEMAADRVMKNVTKFLEESLRVKVNVTKSKVARPQDIKYLGFSFYKKGDKYRPKPHLKSVVKLKEKLHELSKRSWSIDLSSRLVKLNQVIRGWIQYFKICDMKTIMKTVDRFLRVRIRMCIWKAWKTPQRREKALIQLGFPKWMAHRNANTSKGCMAIATSGIMTRTITNARLKQKGLLSLEDQYNLVHI